MASAGNIMPQPEHICRSTFVLPDEREEELPLLMRTF
jgi:hypothetical protein